MKAIVAKDQKLVPIEVDKPVPDPHEIVIRVAAAGVNRADILQKRGVYPPPDGASEILGLEVSGIVDSVGESVGATRVGDRVMALLQGGGYAEYVSVDERLALPIPADIPLIDAAGIPEVAATVWSNLFEFGALKPGQTVLIHGGSGGIGSMAIQIAHQNGSRVITTAGSDRGCARSLSLGADYAVNYRSRVVESEVDSMTNSSGVDLILDILGGGSLNSNIGMLANEGKLVIIGTQYGREGNLQLGPLMRKRASIIATTLRGRSLKERVWIMAQVHDNILPMLASRKVIPVIDSVYDITNVEMAHDMLDSSNVFGKILLTFS